MRINKFVALATGVSRRAADELIAAGRVHVDGRAVAAGTAATTANDIRLDGRKLQLPEHTITIMLNKPVGYVVSRDGQGSQTIYDLLPPELHHLKPVGRLDKDSSGLLLLTNDGALAQQLTHPSFQKQKVYEVALDKPLTPSHWAQLVQTGVQLEDGSSTFDELRWLEKNDGHKWMVVMRQGRNRQIRRTFAALGYTVVRLHRTHFGPYSLAPTTPPGNYTELHSEGTDTTKTPPL